MRENSGRARCALAMFTVIALSSEALGQLPCSYEVTVLPPFNSCFGGDPVPGTPTAINNLGHVLLFRSQCAEPGYNDTYVWTGGASATLIPRPPGMLGFTGFDLNDNGLVCGEAWYEGSVGLRGVIYNTNTGQWTVLPPMNPPLGWSSVSAINNNGEACGYRSIGSESTPLQPQTAFLWSNRVGFIDLGTVDGQSTIGFDINSAHEVAVADSTILGIVAALWNGVLQTPIGPMPDGSMPIARRLNDLGAIAGPARLSSASSQPFIWHEGVSILLGRLPGFNVAGVGGINNQNVVTGSNTNTTTSLRRGYVWQGGVLRDLTSLVVNSSLAITRPLGINNQGLIIADVSPSAAVLLTPQFPAPGNTNCDAFVNVNDLLAVVTTWGPCIGCAAELTGDGLVSLPDLLEVIDHWGATGGAP